MKTTTMKKILVLLALFSLIPLIWSFANYIAVPGVSTDHWKFYAKWSPDGKWITYAEQDTTGAYRIWVVPSEGGNAINLTKNYEGARHIFPSFTSDSKEVTFSCNGPDFRKDSKIVNVNIETGEFRVIMTNATNGCWSHNGRYLFFKKADTGELALYDTQSQNVSILAVNNYATVNGNDFLGVPCFTNDDEYLIITLLTPDGKPRLFKIPITGGNPIQLTNQWGIQCYPECSPDGSSILYTNCGGGGYSGQQLFVYNISAQKSVLLFPNTENINWCGSFSHDGKKLCYIYSDYWYYSQLVTADMPQLDFSPSRITVISPNGGETWISDKEQTIKWTSEGINSVFIDYSLNGGTNWMRLTNYVNASQGSFTFMPPDAFSTSCLIRVYDRNNYNKYLDTSDAVFTISPNTLRVPGVPSNTWKSYAKWSPDGKWITYAEQDTTVGYHVWDKMVTYHVWIVPSGGGTAIKLTNNYEGARHIFPCFTRDSKEVTFSCQGSDFRKDSKIVSINIDTGITRVILTNATNGNWSHNGRYLVYFKADTGDLALYDAQTQNVSILVVNNNTTINNKDFFFGVPCFSNDDEYVIFTLLTASGLYKIPISGGNPIQLTNQFGRQCYPECSPDGSTILYTNFDDWGEHLCAYNMAAQKSVLLFYDTWGGSYSPDGGKICYLASIYYESKNELLIDNMPQLDLSQPKITLLSPNGGEDWSADKGHPVQWISEGINTVMIRFSSDGGNNWKIFGSHVKASQGSFNFTPPDTLSTTCLSRVYDQDNMGIFDTNDAAFTISPIPASYGTKITFDGGNWYTKWSHDGKWISYIHNWNDVFIVPSTGGQPINLTEFTSETCLFPCFSSDSKEICIYQSTNVNGEMTRINLETMNHSVILDNAVNGVWSHNGRYFSYREYGTADLYVLDTVDNKSWLLADASKEWELYQWNAYGTLCFTHDDSAIITTMCDGTKMSLFKIPITGGERKQLTFNEGNHWYPDCSPDGQWILYTIFFSGNDFLHVSSYPYRIFAYNTITGENLPVFPDSQLNSHGASFSPDGTKFSYVLSTKSGNNVYVADFPFKSRINAVNENTFPQSYSLKQNWPNPFNPTTLIGYTVPGGKSEHVRLKIYDSRGAFVKSLFDGATGPGNYSAIWDGTDAGGKIVASGVYMYRLQAGEFVQSRKMLLLR